MELNCWLSSYGNILIVPLVFGRAHVRARPLTVDMILLYSLITAHPSKSVVTDESKKAQLCRHRQVEQQARRRKQKDACQKEGIYPDQHHEGLSTDEEVKESDKQGFV